MKFKVGDKVRVVMPVGGNSMEFGLKGNEIGKITEIDSHNDVYFPIIGKNVFMRNDEIKLSKEVQEKVKKSAEKRAKDIIERSLKVKEE